ncbi:MAG TPA: hypothetical protein VGW78_03450 [Candidatus Babeliales bacterium]|nr:hypothetical protein [Candidatus Babeliales bacterium]
MKNYTQLLLCGLLAMHSTTFLPAQEAVQKKSTWQQWKRPIIATTLLLGSIASWYLLDLWIKKQFDSRVNETVQGLTEGIKGYSFFNYNGTLRKHPFISDAEFKDYQLHENADFDAMFVPVYYVLHKVLKSMKYRTIDMSHVSYLVRSFNIHLLAYQIGSKLCFLTSMLGSYLLIQNPKESEDEKVQA